MTHCHITKVLHLLQCWCESCLSHGYSAFNILHFKTLRVIYRWWELMYFCVIIMCSGINQMHRLLFIPNKHYVRNTFRSADYCHQNDEAKYLLITVSLELSLIAILIWCMFPPSLLPSLPPSLPSPSFPPTLPPSLLPSLLPSCCIQRYTVLGLVRSVCILDVTLDRNEVYLS